MTKRTAPNHQLPSARPRSLRVRTDQSSYPPSTIIRPEKFPPRPVDTASDRRRTGRGEGFRVPGHGMEAAAETKRGRRQHPALRARRRPARPLCRGLDLVRSSRAPSIPSDGVLRDLPAVNYTRVTYRSQAGNWPGTATSRCYTRPRFEGGQITRSQRDGAPPRGRAGPKGGGARPQGEG